MHSLTEFQGLPYPIDLQSCLRKFGTLGKSIASQVNIKSNVSICGTYSNITWKRVEEKLKISSTQKSLKPNNSQQNPKKPTGGGGLY